MEQIRVFNTHGVGSMAGLQCCWAHLLSHKYFTAHTNPEMSKSSYDGKLTLFKLRLHLLPFDNNRTKRFHWPTTGIVLDYEDGVKALAVVMCQ